MTVTWMREPTRRLACMMLACMLFWGALARSVRAEDLGLPVLPPMTASGGEAENWILGVGDEIEVEDVTMGKLTESRSRILADGTVDLPLVGQVTLAGLNLDAAEAMLNEKYRAYFVNPVITMQVTYQHPIRFYVKGAVPNPGVYVSGKNLNEENGKQVELGTANTHYFFYKLYLTDALLLVGGLNHNADMRHIRVHRTYPKREILTVDLWDLFRNGATSQDIALNDQDVVEVPALSNEQMVNNPDMAVLAGTNISRNRFSVNVIGAVNKPGTYQVGGQDNVLSAIAEAGGLSELADADAVYILRANSAGQVFKRRIDVSKGALLDEKRAADPAWASLLPEDVVFVEASGAKKVFRTGLGFLDRTSGAAMFPFFNRLLEF